MKTRKLAAAAVVITCLGAALPAMNWAQEEEARVEEKALREQEFALRQVTEAQKAAAKEMAKAAELVRRGEEDRFRQNPFSGWAGPPGPMFVSGPKGIPRHLTQIQEAAEYYCDAKDKVDKEKALKRLHNLASKYFEEDMEVRKKELADIEARLDKLRSQLERRRAKKDEIVDLQVKVAINEAEGLGFTSAAREDFKFNFRVAVPVTVAPEAPKFDVVTTPQSSDLFSPPVRLEAAIPVPPSPPLLDLQPLSRGAEGDAVRLLQQALNERMEPSPNIAVDGDFGPETETAVKTFQAQHGMKETGVADAATCEMLDMEPTRRRPTSK